MSFPLAIPALHPAAAPTEATLELRASTYDDRRQVLASLMEALLGCGCWLLERKAVTLTQTDFCLELQWRSVVEFYAALIAGGLELSRASHMELTSLCLLGKHPATPKHIGRVLTVRLHVSFLDELGPPARVAPAAAAA